MMTSRENRDRLKTLESKINSVKKREKYRQSGKKSKVGYALKLSTEFASALIVGIVIGTVLDRWLETEPLFIIIFIFLSIAAGLFNIFKSVRKIKTNHLHEKDSVDNPRK
jgi:ATP synthase protein I